MISADEMNELDEDQRATVRGVAEMSEALQGREDQEYFIEYIRRNTPPGAHDKILEFAALLRDNGVDILKWVFTPPFEYWDVFWDWFHQRYGRPDQKPSD